MRNEKAWVVEGLVTGLVGYGTVVGFFAVLDLVSGEGLLHTPTLLGSALFFGAEGGGAQGPAPAIAYNGLHILVSLLIGLGAAWLVFQTEKHRPLWYIVFFVLLAGFIYSSAMVGVLAAEVAHLLTWPAILGANLAAGVTAGGYLWWRHARLFTELGEVD